MWNGRRTGWRDDGSSREGAAHETPAQEVSTLRTEISDIRDDLGHYISELDRRRHEAFDFRHQLQKHRQLAIGLGIGLAGLAGAFVAWRVRQARRPLSVAQRLQQTLNDRVVDRVRKADLATTLGRAAIGIAAAGAAAAIKGVVERKIAAANARGVRESPHVRPA